MKVQRCFFLFFIRRSGGLQNDLCCLPLVGNPTTSASELNWVACDLLMQTENTAVTRWSKNKEEDRAEGMTHESHIYRI